jgi:hypothetical protein
VKSWLCNRAGSVPDLVPARTKLGTMSLFEFVELGALASASSKTGTNMLWVKTCNG